MFEAIIEASNLKQYVDAVTAIDDEARVQVYPNGLRTAVVGPAQVIMCRTMLGTAAFESFEAEERALLGLQFTGAGEHKVTLEDALGFVDNDATLRLRFDGDDDRRLYITGDGHDFELATLDPESVREEPDIPDLDLPNRIVLEGRHLSKATDAAALASDHFHIEGRPEDGEVDVFAGGDTDNVSRTLAVGDELDDGDSAVAADVGSMYPCKEMKAILRPIPADTVVDVGFGDGMPMKWSYQYADTAGSVTNMIAPRIETQ